MEKMIERALSYASKGYHVFPCKPRGKEPATPNGFKDATTHEATIRDWWEREPEYNIGLPTGEVNDFWVLDVDGEKGQESIKRFMGDIPHDTPRVNTGNGYHLYFAHAEELRNSASVMAEGLDVRGEGGFVVAPGSIHESGAVYEWANASREPTRAPESLLRALKEGVRQRRSVDFGKPIPESQRNAQLTRIAGQLTRMGLDATSARTMLHEVNRNQCQPPLDADEVDDITLYENANSESSSSSSLGSSGDDYDFPPFRRFMDMNPPTGERPYIVDGVLFKGFAGAIYGDGGTAKSMLMMHVAQCVARGVDWLGFDTVQTNVLYLDFELDGEEQSRRAYDIAAGMGYEGPPEGFYYLSAAGYPARAIFLHALTLCKKHNIGMVIVDSLGYALDGDAEASKDVLRFFREVEGCYRRESISLMIVDHQPKGGNYQDRTMFGSVYKSNSVRSVFQVEPSEHDDGYVNLTLRHKKINFGPKLTPFGVKVTFGDNKVSVDERVLDDAELATETTVNARDRIKGVLAEGPMFPYEIENVTELDHGTVKNTISKLRKAGEVEDTGNVGKYGAKQVQLTSSSSQLNPSDNYDYDFGNAAVEEPIPF